MRKEERLHPPGLEVVTKQSEDVSSVLGGSIQREK